MRVDLRPAIRLGLCCINSELREKDIFCSRTMPRRTFSVDRARELALRNLDDAVRMMEWNAAHGIHVFRLSSDILPHFTDPETEKYSLDFAREKLEEVGKAAVRFGQRLTMHPGQFNQVGAVSQEVFEKTAADLAMHADLLDGMGTDPNESVLCVHGGGVYGDKSGTIGRWIRQFDELPAKVRRRLAIENCEKCYSPHDCLCIAERCGIPMILDSHHEACYRMLHPSEAAFEVEDMIPQILDTWRGVPLFHVSDQRPGARVGAHSDFVERLPGYMLDVPDLYGSPLDVEVEAKAKEKAIAKLYETHKNLVI
jgi:UV DNA damage endonuclease